MSEALAVKVPFRGKANIGAASRAYRLRNVLRSNTSSGSRGARYGTVLYCTGSAGRQQHLVDQLEQLSLALCAAVGQYLLQMQLVAEWTGPVSAVVTGGRLPHYTARQVSSITGVSTAVLLYGCALFSRRN